MDIGLLNGISEISESKRESGGDLSSESLKKYDKILGDNEVSRLPESDKGSLPIDINDKFDKLCEKGDFFVKEKESTPNSSLKVDDSPVKEEIEQEKICFEVRDKNSEYEEGGNKYETDDNGNTYKKNGEILPDSEYTVNSNIYKTDEYGNKISVDSKPEYTEDGSRNMKEQKESGGEERQDDDDGGHLIARILGGSEGEENLVPMRRTLNRGDYKRMENEISKALQDGKEVNVHLDIEYDNLSKRPSKLDACYTIDGKNTETKFDNIKGSTELMDYIEGKISEEDYNRLKERVEDMQEDGIGATITSVKTEYDVDGAPAKVTVGILDESTGEKIYKEYEPR
jgi:hypothetical protein